MSVPADVMDRLHRKDSRPPQVKAEIPDTGIKGLRRLELESLLRRISKSQSEIEGYDAMADEWAEMRAKNSRNTPGPSSLR